MKCPKCSYLGFETGDRCRNCGYDFSLMAIADKPAIELDLDLRRPVVDAPESPDWPMRGEGEVPLSAPAVPISATVRRQRSEPPPVPSAAKGRESKPARDSKLPLFTASSRDKGDEPLIKLPVTPRPPLAVRRTPDTARLQAVSRAVRGVEREPALEFDQTIRRAPERDAPGRAPAHPVSRPAPKAAARVAVDVSQPVIRMIAAAIDHVLLGAIDLVVIYLTLRISGLTMGEWTALPLVPLVFFLLLVKLAYFYAFTAVGGQTIGKMALRIRVVTEDHGSIDAALALRRTVIGAASTAFLGLGLLPAFFDPERRAFHDRVARTRVIALRPA